MAYRVSSFHPLFKYPGPILFRVSRLPALWILLQGKQHQYYQALHIKYGRYVRTGTTQLASQLDSKIHLPVSGPNHLHISDAGSLPIIQGSPRFLKSARYDAIKRPEGISSILGLRSLKEHSQRRRLWDRGLNKAALKDYDMPLAARTTELVDNLVRKCDTEVVDFAQWLSYFSFDFMGDLAYGGVYNVMRIGKDDTGIIALSKCVVALHEAAGTIPWIRAFFNYLPLGSSNLKSHMNFAKQTILNRIERGPSSTRDLFSYLLGEYEDDPRLDTPTLIAEAVFAIIAGSDTTAAALSNVFFFLVSSTKVFHRLRTELDELNCHTDATAAELANLPYLNAVINESLRLQPLAPNGLQRVLTNENGAGEMVNGYYIPPMTNVQVSHYCIHHDPEYWSPYPDRFWPERWLANATEFMTEPERQHYRMGQEIAFFPFSHGPTACAGKALALVEMRTVIAAIVANFDIAFEPGWDTREWERDLKDFFILRVGRLPVIFTARK
ncbi:hypothetical protein VNI00_014313 [Paramarasmius palmivorus]|uniref:Cytochrome P450 n=1 Tax=Paramarasmius palmivorus TaxID=297713 RepID=A0AAW0BQP2_9AGAR